MTLSNSKALCVLIVLCLQYLAISSRPNIIFMFGDDVGYNDVEFTSDDLTQPSASTKTPHMNELATKEGLILKNYYVQRMCSPSRASFLSGRYSFRYGLSTHLLEADIKVSLTRQVSLISEEFLAAGYATHAIGKWHLGFQSWEYAPTYRGFETFYGYLNSWADYYTSQYNVWVDDIEEIYYDLRENEEAVMLSGSDSDNPVDFSMYRFRDHAIRVIEQSVHDDRPFFMYVAWQSNHFPSEAPEKYLEIYEDEDLDGDTCRLYAQAQGTLMDDAIYDVVSKLKELDLWDNTLIVWSSDNGGAATVGDNFPLRGYKKTTFEGGVRVPAFVTGGYLQESRRNTVIGTKGEYFHVTDWYPTLLEAAGITPSYKKSTRKENMDSVVEWETADYDIPLDGTSIWDQIQHGVTNDELTKRLMVIDYVLDDNNDLVNGTLRLGKWKYIKGLGSLDDYDGDDGYLWGDQFADITTDAHLWGSTFANLDVPNSLGCDLDAEPNNLMCFYTDEGCLYDLENDPCEYNDVSDENPTIFAYLREKLANLKDISPTDVGGISSYQLDAYSADHWLPENTGEFWTPWQDYTVTEFEQVLYSDYAGLYGDEASAAKLREFFEVDLDQLQAANVEMEEVVELEEVVEIASSCNAKKDGLHYIKPTKYGEVIPVICNDGFTMLDASLNFDSLATYFSSIYQYGNADKTIYGTDCGDDAGWREWYSPANKNTKFRVALNCLSCEQGGIYGENTGYYMTNGYFCPVNLDIDGCSAQKDLAGQMVPDVMCNVCDDQDGLCGEGEGRDGSSIYDPSADTSWCDCWSLQLTADHKTTGTHKEYCQEDLNWRPNLVVDRSQCTCYKPLDAEVKTYKVKTSELPSVSTEYQDEIVNTLGLYVDDLIVWDGDVDSDSVDCDSRTTYLSQEDFLYGTYRITECGTYVLTEDITVNFNKPATAFSYENGDSPNSYNYENLPWFPSNEQQDSGLYFGLNAFWGPYSIGFPAAITIETSSVKIDLNGFTLAMDREFYLQQRFFALILMANKPFEARQGPVDFGRDDLCNKEVTITGGTLGLSSHHGIMGSCMKNVEISDLKIQNFDTHGIQCNGCQWMTIENCEIGPQNTNIPVKGRYTHGRIILARLRYLVDEYGDEPIRFANRKKTTTVKAVADKLVEQLDMVYYHIMNGIEFDDDDEQWMAAKKTFINPTGWLDGGSAYGILLNGYGTAVVNIGRRVTNTEHITIKNVEIHNIKSSPVEGMWASVPSTTNDYGESILHGFFFETIDWRHGNVYDETTGHYVGDAYTDILFAAQKYLIDDFCPVGSLFYLDGMDEWAFTDGQSMWAESIGISLKCGSDIQSHSAKGTIGIRIDGVQNYHLEDIYIHNVVNWGEQGSELCGEYEKITFEIGVDVDKDIQLGYTGTKVHGILTDYASGTMKNIKIAHLKSYHGSVNAIALYKGSQVTMKGNFDINQVVAGSQITKAQALKAKLPNPAPFVCSIFIGPNSDMDSNPDVTPVVAASDDFTVLATSLYGYDYCESQARVGAMDAVNAPEVLAKATVVNGQLLFEVNRNTAMLVALSVIAVIAIMLYHAYSKCKHPENGKKLTNKVRRAVSNYGTL